MGFFNEGKKTALLKRILKGSGSRHSTKSRAQPHSLEKCARREAKARESKPRLYDCVKVLGCTGLQYSISC